MRIAIVTGMWKRPEVFQMFVEGVKHLQETFKEHEIICCVTGSEGFESRYRVEKNQNFFYTEVPNYPLSEKFNRAVFLAKKLSPDYCLMVGSDDIIGVNLMARYIELMGQGIDYAYLMDCYFFDTVTKKGLYWGGYTRAFNRGRGAGIGRLISATALNAVQWICWPPGFDRVLDTAFDRQMERIKCSRIAIHLRNEKLFALDIKSSVNMTPFTQWDNSEYLDGKKVLFENLPKHLAEKIYG